MILRRSQPGVARALVLAWAVALLSLGGPFTPGSEVAAGQAQNTAYTELAIGGLKGEASVKRVEEALAAVPGVLEASVSLEDGRASIILDGDAIPSQESLIQAVTDAGYTAASVVGRDYQAYEAFESAGDDAVAGTPGAADAENPEASSPQVTARGLHELSKDARELKDRFNRDSDKLRLVVLLSPT